MTKIGGNPTSSNVTFLKRNRDNNDVNDESKYGFGNNTEHDEVARKDEFVERAVVSPNGFLSIKRQKISHVESSNPGVSTSGEVDDMLVNSLNSLDLEGSGTEGSETDEPKQTPPRITRNPVKDGSKQVDGIMFGNC